MREEFLRLFCSNVRGLVCNWDAATSFDWNNYDILAFNEVWNIKDFENLVVENYEIKAKKLRTNSRGGGSIIFGKKNLQCKEIETPFLEGCIETTGIRCNGITFINIYRPPSGNKQRFLEILGQFLETLNGKKLIGGDININLFTEHQIINNFCLGHGLTYKINAVTRIPSGTCIDNFLTNLDGVFEVSDISIADHLAITAKVIISCKNSYAKTKFSYRQMKEANYIAFNANLYNLEITGQNIDEKWDNLQSSIKKIVDDCFPLKTSSHKYLFTMSPSLLKCRDKKNRLLRQFKQGRINKEVYLNYNKIYRKLIKTEQVNSFHDSLQKAGINGKAKWKAIKSHLHLERSKPQIDELVVDNESITSKTDIAKAFKSHFETCAKKLAENLPPGCNTAMVIPQGEPWSFKSCNESDLLKIIRTLKNKNSCGIDGLSNRMLKKEAYRFAVLLKPLINESISLGQFPNCLKTANVIPIHKKGSTSDLNNYRPISLLPVISKVFEKVINNQLNSVVESGFIDDNQFGFRQGYSTEDAAIKFINEVQKELRANKHVVTLYVDVSKAFDSCDHDIIVNKIKQTGLNEQGLNLIRSYLLDRSQLVFVDGIFGGKFVVNIGVGQGTILGPTFFKIYIMDLHLHTTLFCTKFADDSNFMGSGKTRDEVTLLVNNELKKISKWFTDNRLTLHPNKSRFIVHSRDKLIDLFLNNTKIMRCGYGLQEESVKFLGLHIDENLDWTIHIKNVVKKIEKGRYLLWRHKKLGTKIQKILYESFVRCHLLYCLVVWGGASASKLKPLETVVKKCWKNIGHFKQHTLNRLKNANILKIADELTLQESKIVWRWEYNKLPNSLRPIIEEKRDNLRHRRFHIPRGAKPSSIISRLNKRAEKSITSIAQSLTKKPMATKLKSSLIENYSFVCRRRDCFTCAGRDVNQ